MNFPALARTGFAVALSAVLVSMAAPVMAGEQTGSIFSQVAPSLRDRMFFRINYIRANVKTTAGDAYDVTGPVVAKGELEALLGSSSSFSRSTLTGNQNIQLRSAYSVLDSALDPALDLDAKDPVVACPSVGDGIGTPCGVRARSHTMVGTPALSIGYYFDDDLSWVVEAYVLAAPLKVDVYGQGASQLNGHKILDTKMLPPIVVFGKYFGTKDSVVRPFVGLGGSYAFFYDTNATDYLNRYEGGSSSGSTTVHLKNATGFGPFLGLKAGLDDSWHVSLNVGKLKYKTEATLTTNNTKITGSSLVLQDLTPNVKSAVNTAAAATILNRGSLHPGVGEVGNLMCDLAMAKYGSSDCNLGTYVRKQSTTMDATMFMLSVGRSF
jgi:outer membrane protein W